jgi:hypothetical protein
MSVVENIKKKITEGDLVALGKALGDLELDKIKFIPRMQMFGKLLDFCRMKEKGLNVLSKIVQTWVGDSELGDSDGIVSDICGIIFINVKSIGYLISQYEDVIPEEVLLINLENESKSKAFSFPLTADRLDQAMKFYSNFYTESDEEYKSILEVDAWARLYDVAVQKNRVDAISYIENKLQSFLEPAKIPEYITNIPKMVDVVSTNALEERARTAKIVKRFVSSDNDTTSEVVNNKISSIVDSLGGIDRKNILKMFSTETEPKNEIDPDMLEGPENVIIDSYKDEGVLVEEIHPCLGKPDHRNVDGCRMLTCICIADDPYGEYLEVQRMSWFKGKCDLCKSSIIKPAYAMRLPKDKGGWEGCYCSSKCAIDHAISITKPYIESGAENFESYRRLNEIDAAIQYKGILDRDDIYDEEQPKEKKEPKKEPKKEKAPKRRQRRSPPTR